MELSENIECKICKETEFKFHETKEIYNPCDDTYQDINNVQECKSCGTLYFSTDTHDCFQLDMVVNEKKYVTKFVVD